MSCGSSREFSGSLSIAIEKFSCKAPRLRVPAFPAQRLCQRRAVGSNGPHGSFPQVVDCKGLGLWLHESARAKELDRLVGSLPQRKIGEHFAKDARELEAVPRT